MQRSRRVDPAMRDDARAAALAVLGTVNLLEAVAPSSDVEAADDRGRQRTMTERLARHLSRPVHSTRPRTMTERLARLQKPECSSPGNAIGSKAYTQRT
jgi:hypothetical protein